MAPLATPPSRLLAPAEFAPGPEIYDGPLDALLAAVRDYRVDLAGLDVAPICAAYLEYVVRHVGAQDVDAVSGALAGLAYLLERKAFRLVPVAPTEEDFLDWEEPAEPPEPSIAEFAGAISVLEGLRAARETRFFRAGGAVPYELPFVLSQVTPEDLARAFRVALERAENAPVVEPPRPRRSLEKEMLDLMARMGGHPSTLRELLSTPFGREDVVYGFLAVLELMRQGRIVASRGESGDVLFTPAQPALPLEGGPA